MRNEKKGRFRRGDKGAGYRGMNTIATTSGMQPTGLYEAVFEPKTDTTPADLATADWLTVSTSNNLGERTWNDDLRAMSYSLGIAIVVLVAERNVIF